MYRPQGGSDDGDRHTSGAPLQDSTLNAPAYYSME